MGSEKVSNEGSIGSRIRDYRELSGIKQKELAEILKVSVQAVSQYELGKRNPGVKLLSRIAQELGVSVQELIGESSLNTVSRLSGIGGNIKKARKAKGMGQDEFAEALGKSLRMIQKYEAEEYSNTRVIPALEVIEDIANVLDISVQDLIGLGGEDESNSAVAQFENKELVDERLIQKLSNRIFRLYNDEKIKEYEINIKDNSFSFYVLWGNGYGGIIKGNMNEECKSLDKFIRHIEDLESEDLDE